jgi:hypothetical protein
MTKPAQQILMRAEYGGRRFCIEFSGEGVGYYLYVYDGERCTHDYLQDTLAFAQADALELFGVPLESWTNEIELAS